MFFATDGSFTISPTPEPVPAGLLCLGLALLGPPGTEGAEAQAVKPDAGNGSFGAGVSGSFGVPAPALRLVHNRPELLSPMRSTEARQSGPIPDLAGVIVFPGLRFWPGGVQID